MRVNQKYQWGVVFSGLLLAGTCGLAADVTVYPKIDHPAFDYNVPEFKVTVEGQSVPVRHYNPFNDASTSRVYYYAHFGVSGGPAQVRIDVGEPITNAVIYPKAYGIEGKVEGSVLAFALDRSRYLAVSINGRKDLFLLADPNETDRPAASGVDPASGKPVFNITAEPFNADATGLSLTTAAITQAVAQAQQGPAGGIVYVPAGKYMTGKFNLGNKVWLYLEPGAVLIADTDRTKWRNEKIQPDAIINVGSAEDVKIYGRGVVFCNSIAINARLKELKESQPDVYGKYGNLRLRPFNIRSPKRFMLDGVLINESSAWTVYIQGGSDINVVNTKVLNLKLNAGTNDGINIGGGRNITVRHCFTSSLDDAVCLKGIMGTIDNVLLEDVVADSARSSIKFGMQGITPVMNVTVRDFHGTRGAKGLDISHDLGQSDYRNIRILDSTFTRSGYPLRITVRDNARNWGGSGCGVASVVGVELNRVNFDVPEDQGKFYFAGYDPDNVVRDIVLNEVVVSGKPLTAADVGAGKDKRIEIGPYVANVTVGGEAVAIPEWPPKKEVKNPPPSKSRAGKTWEETQSVKADP